MSRNVGVGMYIPDECHGTLLQWRQQHRQPLACLAMLGWECTYPTNIMELFYSGVSNIANH